MSPTKSRVHNTLTVATRALAALCTMTMAAPVARAEVLAYDEHDGESGGTVGWLNDWQQLARSDGELVQTAGYRRRYFNAPLSTANSTLWLAVTGRMAAQPVGYAYHVPMGVTSWTASHQHHGLHFDTSSTFGLFVNTPTPNSGVLATTQQTWLSRYVFGPANANGRFNATVSVWAGSGVGRRIDPGAPPAAAYTLSDTTLDSLYAGQNSASDAYFVERESVATSAREALAAPERDLYVVAHQDDDLLFMNPDIANSIQAGNHVQTVYLTAGAGGNELEFVHAREMGIKAAYASMAGLADAWTCAEATVAGKGLMRCTLDGSAGRVGVVFLRLPSDGDDDDGGEVPLGDLWLASEPSLERFDTSSVTYTRSELIGVLATLMTDFRASRVGILDSDDGPHYHPDHYYASLFAFAAHQAYAAGHGLTTYRSNQLTEDQENLSQTEFDITWDTFGWYGRCDRFSCQETEFTVGKIPPTCGSSNICTSKQPVYIDFAHRRYVGSMITSVSGHIAGLGGRCLQPAGGGTASGTPVQIADCAVTAAQQWTESEGRIRGPGGKCLAIAGGSSASGAAAQIADCAGTADQKWTVLDSGQIRGIEGMCLAVAGANPASGTPLEIAVCNGTQAQQFAIQFAPSALWSQGSDFSDSQLGATNLYTRTVRLGDVNGDGRDDACVRRSDGVWCALSNGTAFGAATRYTPLFSNTTGWGQDFYGHTIQLGDVNGDGRADLCGRGLNGIECQVANASGTAFVTSGALLWTTAFSDAQGYTGAETYYRSIRLGDVDGDGYADVCGRRIEGVWCAINTQSGAFGAVSLWSDVFSNENGWLQTPYGTTLQLGDINGDGMADVCGRGPTGVQCAVARAAGPGFERAHVWSYSRGNAPDFGDGSEFDAAASYYQSLDLADLDGDGDADLCGRGAGGALCALSNGLGFGKALPGSLGAFADAGGWLPTRYGATVQLGDVDGDGRADLCGRAASGLWCSLAP